MSDEFKVLLRTWHRFTAADFWSEVERSGSLVVHAPNAHFRMDAFYDPGPPTASGSQPSVVFRGYLFDTPPPEIREILLRTRTPDPTSWPAVSDGMGGFPQAYAKYLSAKATHLSKLCTDACDLLLWRQKVLDGPPSLTIEPTRLFWAEVPSEACITLVEDLKWYQVPSGIHLLDLPPGKPLDLRPEAGDRLSEILGTRDQAPLGHVLFREAWRVRASNLRSALVMGVAAAETGAKEFIRGAAPETSWLIENLQSPPLDKLIKDYLPTLPSRAGAHEFVPPIPKLWRTAFSQGIEARNRVVHGRALQLDRDQVEATLDCIVKFLYFLDYHAGCAWANLT